MDDLFSTNDAKYLITLNTDNKIYFCKWCHKGKTRKEVRELNSDEIVCLDCAEKEFEKMFKKFKKGKRHG